MRYFEKTSHNTITPLLKIIFNKNNKEVAKTVIKKTINVARNLRHLKRVAKIKDEIF